MQHRDNCPYFGVDFSSLDNIFDENLLFSQIDFMWCRAWGSAHTGAGDTQTIEFVEAARRHGKPVGCYYFATPLIDAAAGISTDAQIIAHAEEQAQQFIDKLYLVFGHGNVGDLMPMVDVEQYVDKLTQYGHTPTYNERYPQAVMTSEQLVTFILAFKNYFNSVTGWRLGMYTGEYWIKAPRPTEGAGLTDAQIASLNPPEDPLPLWIARYDEYNTVNTSVPNIGNYTKHVAWQYTGTGNAAAYGIANDAPYQANNYLDLNRAENLEDMKAVRIGGGGSNVPAEQYVKDKALEFTSIEYETLLAYPNNYGRTAGNFDDQGMSFGCIQFNFGQGSLQPIFMHMLQNHWVKTKACFSVEADFTTFEYNLWNYSLAQLVAWGDSITDWKLDEFGQKIAGTGSNIKKPWRDYFHNIGILPECILKQQEQAENPYHVNARTFFKEYALWTRRGYALMFDISVQSGSIGAAARTRIFSRFAAQDFTGLSAEEIETEKMKIIVDERSKDVSSTWRPSWIERKSSIALGQFNVTSYGKWVYTEPYDLILEPAFSGYIKSTIYVVESGDSFSTIAAKHNTDSATIEAMNPSTDSASLLIGQAVNVPYETTETGTGSNKVYLGGLSIKNIFLGNSEIAKVFLGNNEVFSQAPALPVTTISPAETVQNNISVTITLSCSDPNATIYYKIGTGTQQTYSAPFSVSQSHPNVQGTQIAIIYWAVGVNGTEEQKTITYDTSSAKPSVPVLSATAETGQVALSWTAASNATGYTVFRSTIEGDKGTALTGTEYMTGRTWTDSTVTGGTTYYYTVQASNWNLATDSIQQAATPTAVAGHRYIRQWMNGGYIVPSATATNLNSMIEFQAISAADGNVLLNKVDLEAWPSKLGGTSNPTSNITDGITADMWSYAVWSDSTGGVPQKITYDMGKLYTDLTEVKTWHNYASAGRFYNFKIQACATNSPNDADWTTIIDAMDNSTARTYEESVNGFTFLMPMPAPSKPILEITNLYNAVRLDWQVTTDTTSYKIYRATNPANLGTNLIEITDGTTTYTDATAVGGNTYYYTVKALNITTSTNSDKMTGIPSAVMVYENKNVDFEGKTAWTVYDAAQVTADFGNADTVQGGDRLKIDTSGRLRFELPADMLGSANTGGIIKAAIVGKKEYTFEYEIRFDSGFPWSKGGKIAGFSGGKGYTGGEGELARTLGDGFSVRMMWREGGRLIPYVYHAGMAEGENYGDTFGATVGYATDTKAFTVKYYAKLNTGSNADGILRIYLDGVLSFEKTNLLYRTDDSKIDMAHLAFFAGGSTSDWNMTGLGYIRLSNFNWY
jgi:hypothetical protein